MKRTWWFGAGFCAGLGSAAWLRGKARATAERYTPANVRSAVADRSRETAQRARQTAADTAKDVGRGARRIADDIRHAVAEGREAMLDTETELRDDEPANDPGPP